MGSSGWTDHTFLEERRPLHPTSYACARCGMASPVDEVRCRSCGARRFVSASPAGPARTGPAAAEAWAASRAAAPVEGDGGAGSTRPRRRRTHPVGPWAVAAWRVLHVFVLVGLGVAVVAAGRLVLVVAAEDQAVLVAEDWWEALDGLAGVLAVVLLVTGALGALLVVAWGAAAGQNLSQLSLDAGAWTRSTERVLGRLLVATAALGGWLFVPDGPGQADRAVDLALAAGAAAAVTAVAAAVQRLLVVVTTAELERAEWLVRLEAAAAPRPTRRDAIGP